MRGWLLILLLCSLTSAHGEDSTPQQVKDRLDERLPLPLSPQMAHKQLANMRQLFEHVQMLIEGLGKNDFKMIEAGAARFTTNSERVKMAKEMGRSDQPFAEMGILMLESGDTLMDAVKKRDIKNIQVNLGQLLSNCNACHNAYKQKIIPEADFLKLKPILSHSIQNLKLSNYVLAFNVP